MPIGRGTEIAGADVRVPDDLQLTLGAFDRTLPPLCSGSPDCNVFRRLCCQCPHALREGGAVYCTVFDRAITARDKYGLAGWKALRTSILVRDGGRCAVCGAITHLHVHHIDRDPTNDAPGNLVTLCEACHARAHRELYREGEAARAAQVLTALRDWPGP
ncbi:MAG TPA: HNH endonuclease [Methanoculleus sp.]|nr:HNH endonuclease [Methanoculleus sp.]